MLASMARHAGAGIIDRLKSSGTVARRAQALCVDADLAETAPTPSAVRKLARRLGTEASIIEWRGLNRASQIARSSGATRPLPPEVVEAERNAVRWGTMAEHLGVDKGPKPALLNGRDLIERGMKPGREFAPLLAEALDAQDDGAFVDRDGALAWLAAKAA